VPAQSTHHDRIRREARVVGLRAFRTPSLEAVERRRLQLWFLSSLLLMSVVLGLVALSIWPRASVRLLDLPSLRIAIVLLTVAFCVYSIEKEIHLQRLARLLTDERVLTTALTNRLHEVALLLEAGRAMNSQLELHAVLDTILRSATELLTASSGSIMLADDEDLVVSAVIGNAAAAESRERIGEGIAGYVAKTREPILINGAADELDFPGLVERRPYVDSALSVPLVHRDEVLGVLNVNAERDDAFTPYDLRAVSVFAEQAAAAIANARLYEAERAHVAELRRLRAGGSA
jgi:putative methionine-R-sulfoxide reductase with GAF domain